MDIFNRKKKQQEQERKEKLARLRILWLDYSIHYYQYDIQYKCPITGKVKTHKFYSKINRKTQMASENPKDEAPQIIAMKEAQGFLNPDVAYSSRTGDGIVIHQPLQVKFHEISKKEYDKAK
jgi:hypothetical protein